MPCFAMSHSSSMLLSCSKHCFLMLIPDMLFSLSLWTWYLLHFCHAWLNLLLCVLAVAQCSSFVKHLEWSPAIYFVAGLECCSMLFLMHLDGLVMLIVDRCHMCFACHLQTVHPIPVIFISISTEINSSFQWHSWFSRLSPGAIFPFRSMHMHRIPHPACHTMFMCWLFTMLCASFRCLLLRVGSGNVVFVRTHSSMSVYLLHGLVLLLCGISGKMIIPSKSLLSLLA